MRMDPKKFALYATVVGAFGMANDIGFHGNCEVHENEPACKGISPDPLHTHQDSPHAAYGTNTSTVTATGSGTGASPPGPPSNFTATLTGERMTAVSGFVTAGPQTYPQSTGIMVTDAATGRILNT
jgi:hypothetical protein